MRMKNMETSMRCKIYKTGQYHHSVIKKKEIETKLPLLSKMQVLLRTK